MDLLTDKIAIITGAARGQGAAEARLFIEEGASVVLTDIDDAGQALADELGDRATFLHHDVADADAWATVVAATMDRYGRIDALVNNAAVYLPRPLVDTDRDNFDLHVRVNQLSVYLGMKAVIDPMRDAGGGSIINISSVNGLQGTPGSFAYSMTKWAIRGMTKAAAFELAGDNIRVNSVHPGLIDTPMIDANPEGMNDIFLAYVPMGRKGKPEEVAGIVAFLASDRASYMSGAEISVSGAT